VQRNPRKLERRLRPRDCLLGFPDFFAVFVEEVSQGFADDLAFAAIQALLDYEVHTV